MVEDEPDEEDVKDQGGHLHSVAPIGGLDLGGQSGNIKEVDSTVGE